VALDPDSSVIEVTSLTLDAPAFRAGIRLRDVLESFDGVSIGSISAFAQAVDKLQAGDRVACVVRREGASLTLPVTLDEKLNAGEDEESFFVECSRSFAAALLAVVAKHLEWEESEVRKYFAIDEAERLSGLMACGATIDGLLLTESRFNLLCQRIEDVVFGRFLTAQSRDGAVRRRWSIESRDWVYWKPGIEPESPSSAAASHVAMDDDPGCLNYGRAIDWLISRNFEALRVFKSLSEDAATVLATEVGAHEELPLDGIQQLPVSVASALSGFCGRMSLNSLTDIEPEAVRALTKASSLALNGLHDLSADVADAIAWHTGPLELNGLMELSADIARRLTANRRYQRSGTLGLEGLSALSPQAAVWLGEMNGGLRLRMATIPFDLAILLAHASACDDEPASAVSLRGPSAASSAVLLIRRKDSGGPDGERLRDAAAATATASIRHELNGQPQADLPLEVGRALAKDASLKYSVQLDPLAAYDFTSEIWLTHNSDDSDTTPSDDESENGTWQDDNALEAGDDDAE
jgi:hypothetical protein